ncbi:efflux transporter [Grosmannia clavigera kw1407]|uniref:Efflux transporter n=1 Tax=Grosmannia clavigera (strain kw1407 / UAMH 11150) TaxID=655863 RepID=F0XJJ1_GROCL|nr:efflux transporter [Grosmannia clavigera kw1407]EFX02166.1 efflux transporter [Grosmannia clavigera kw1407]
MAQAVATAVSPELHGVSTSSRPVEMADLEKNEMAEAASRETEGAEIGDKKTADGSDDDMDAGDDADPKTVLPFSKLRCVALVVTTASAGFLNIVSLQSAVIIMPTISRDLNIPASRQQWVLSSYTLAFGCFLLIWGRVADLYGKRPVFILGSAFVVGAAANVPTAIGILGVTFPPGKAKNYAFSAYAAGAPLGGVFGNVLSGLVASYASWKWVFWVIAILSAFITVAGIFVIPELPETRTAEELAELSLLHSVDWIGGALITGGLIALLFSMTEGNIVGWSTAWVIVLILLGLLMIAVFIAWELYQEKHTTRSPLIRLSLFRNRHFSAAVLIMCIFFGIFNDFSVYVTYLWQDYQGYSPIQTMLRFLPGAVTGTTVAIIVARLISQVPTVLILVAGQLATCVALILMAVPLPDSTSYFAYGFSAMVLAVVGADTAWPCLTLFMSKSLPPEHQAMGGALINASGQIGRAIGLAITTAIQLTVVAHERGVPVQDVGAVVKGDPASLRGIRVANWFNLALGGCCVILCAVLFRGTGIVGKIPVQRQRQGGVSA